MIEAIRDFAEALPEVVQWLILLVIGAVPYVEAYGAAFLGVIAGINPAIALVAGVIGNVVSMLLAMKLGHAYHRRSTDPSAPLTARQAKLKRSLDRWGIAVVALIGPTILPSQVTAAGLVGFGADRRRVIAWSIAGILLWAVVFLGLGLLVNRFLG
ncbi:MAG: hypothetical protein GX344_03340 [Intrasporangiaceae bacterium]|nr:hypothetical protein [Intrasporangiaceae bacterium]